MFSDKKRVCSKKAGISLSEIFILVLGVVAFAYLIGSVDMVSGEENSMEWVDFCDNLGGAESGLSLDDIKRLGFLSNINTIGGVQKLGISEANIIKNCKDKPDALAKLSDETLLKGMENLEDDVGDINQLFEGGDNALFDEVQDRMDKAKGIDEGFLGKLNENNDFRKKLLNSDKFPGINIDEGLKGESIPKIKGFDKEAGTIDLEVNENKVEGIKAKQEGEKGVKWDGEKLIFKEGYELICD